MPRGGERGAAEDLRAAPFLGLEDVLVDGIGDEHGRSGPGLEHEPPFVFGAVDDVDPADERAAQEQPEHARGDEGAPADVTQIAVPQTGEDEGQKARDGLEVELGMGGHRWVATRGGRRVGVRSVWRAGGGCRSGRAGGRMSERPTRRKTPEKTIDRTRSVSSVPGACGPRRGATLRTGWARAAVKKWCGVVRDGVRWCGA